MNFHICILDPPWDFKTRSPKGKGRNPARHYKDESVLSIDDLKALKVNDLLKDPGAVFLWVTWPMMPYAFQLFDAWGLKYSTRAWTWAKTTKNSKKNLARMLQAFKDGKLSQKDLEAFIFKSMFHIGNGYTTRANDEVCLLAWKGKALPRASRSIRSLLVAPITRNSEKPEEVQDMIEQLFPGLDYIELFARRARAGWVCLGNEIDGKDIRPAIQEVLAWKLPAQAFKTFQDYQAPS